MDTARGGKRKKPRNTGIVDSRFSHSRLPGNHALLVEGGVLECMRLGSTACTLGSVDVSTLAWLSASICQFVFMFEGFAEAVLIATTTCNSWSFAVNVGIEALAWATRRSTDGWEQRR